MEYLWNSRAFLARPWGISERESNSIGKYPSKKMAPFFQTSSFHQFFMDSVTDPTNSSRPGLRVGWGWHHARTAETVIEFSRRALFVAVERNLWLGKKVFFLNIQKIGDYHSTWNLDKFGNSWWLPFSSSTIFLNCRWSSFYCHNPMMLGNFITSRFKWIGDYHPINWDFPPREDSPIIGVFLAKVSSFRFIRGFMYQWSKPFGRLRDRGSFFALGFCCSCVASQAQWRLESSQHSRHPVYGWYMDGYDALNRLEITKWQCLHYPKLSKFES